MKNLGKKYFVLVGLPVCFLCGAENHVKSAGTLSSSRSAPINASSSAQEPHRKIHHHRNIKHGVGHHWSSAGDDVATYKDHINKHKVNLDSEDVLVRCLNNYVDVATEYFQEFCKKTEKEYGGGDAYKRIVESFAFQKDQDHEMAKFIHNIISKAAEEIQHRVNDTVKEIVERVQQVQQEEKTDAHKLYELLKSVGSNDQEIKNKLNEISESENQEQKILNDMHDAWKDSDHKKHKELQEKLEAHRQDIAKKHQELLNMHHEKSRNADGNKIALDEHRKWINDHHEELRKRNGSLEQRIDHIRDIQSLLLRVFAGVLQDGGYIHIDKDGQIHLTEKANRQAINVNSKYTPSIDSKAVGTGGGVYSAPLSTPHHTPGASPSSSRYEAAMGKVGGTAFRDLTSSSSYPHGT